MLPPDRAHERHIILARQELVLPDWLERRRVDHPYASAGVGSHLGLLALRDCQAAASGPKNPCTPRSCPALPRVLHNRRAACWALLAPPGACIGPHACRSPRRRWRGHRASWSSRGCGWSRAECRSSPCGWWGAWRWRPGRPAWLPGRTAASGRSCSRQTLGR